MGRNVVIAGVCLLSLATTATAKPWDCTVWQWRQSAKLTIGTFTVDPAKIETQKVTIDDDTTASCTGQLDRNSTDALLVCAVYTASTHYAARGVAPDASSYLLVSGNQTDILVDNQIECSPSGTPRRSAR